jgi:hypothetical protein
MYQAALITADAAPYRPLDVECERGEHLGKMPALVEREPTAYEEHLLVLVDP